MTNSRTNNFWRYKRYPSSAGTGISTFKESSNGLNLAGFRRLRKSFERNGTHSKFSVREWNNKNEKKEQCPKPLELDEFKKKPLTDQIKKDALNGRSYKELFKVRARKANAADPVLGEKNNLVKDDGSVADIIRPEKVVETIAEKPASPCEGQRMESDHKRCSNCGDGGKLLSCVGQECGRSFHLCCVNPPFTYFPPGVWHCIWCVKRKMELGVYSVSEGIESVLDAEEVSGDEAMQKRYLVKFKGLAHVHNSWIAEKELLLNAPAVFSRYKKHSRIARGKKKWSEPQRLLAKRLLLLPEQCNSNFNENDHCRCEWLVKWTGLGYNQATWELEDASFLRTPEGMKLINDFATRHEEKEEANHTEEDKRKTSLCKLSELPFGGPDHLIYVNKLREHWYTDKNALIIDEQERVVMVVLFALSLFKEMSGPFLIITTSTSLPMWEAEFRRWASIINVVVYEGSGDIRHIIRTLEFYNEGGCIMFQVLLSPSVAVVEDLENLKPIKWEVIVIDEFQRPKISVHSEQIKMLAANMRLLLVSSQIKDWSLNYLNAFSLLDPNCEGSVADVLEDDGNIDTSELKGKLVDFIVYERKPKAVKLLEFWVPVMLTDVQTEQYCDSLISNSTLVCSYSRSDPACSVHDILKTTRKCCDHPYLVDRSLSKLVLRDKPAPEHFDVEIQMSGKLQLLNKILPEIKKRGLRVVILFQATDCSGKISIGDILDDFIHQKFGTNSYSRIDGEIPRSKKRAMFEMFNNKDNGNFVCLIETRTCLPSTKLSYVDTIIVFNSDWDPMNDLKALQKITIESQFEQLKIFRFYSCYTVEEKVLILAKEGVTFDSNMKNVKQSTCQKLLTWGASWLFRKLDDFHELNASSSNQRNSFGQCLSEDVFQELSALLPCSSIENGSACCSGRKNNSNKVLSVQPIEGTYRGNNLYLVGELKAQLEDNFSLVREMIDRQPHIFWRNLLEGRKPRWKYMSSPLQRIKRKVKFISSLCEETEDEAEAAKKSRTESNNNIFNQTRKRMERGLHGRSYKKMLPVPSLNSGIKRYRKLREVAKDVSLECAKEAVVPSRHHAKKVHNAATLCAVGRPTNDIVPGVELGNSPIESSSLPNELPTSTSSLSVGNDDGHLSESREGQSDHGNVVSASCCLQATVRIPIEGSTWPLGNAVQQSVRNLPLQPAMPLFERSEQDAGNLEQARINPDFLNNHSTEASSGRSQVPQSACSASLKKEMERLQEAKEQALKFHRDLKLQLESECEKEIEEIRKKYDLLLHNAEVVMAEKESELESCYQLAYKQNLLAEAMILKQASVPAADSQGKQEVILSTFIRDIYQSCFRQPTGTTSSGPYPPLVVGSDFSAVEQSAARNPAIPEEDSVEVVNNSSAGQQNIVPTSLRDETPSSNMQMHRPPSQTCAVVVRAQSSAVPHPEIVTTETPYGAEHALVPSGRGHHRRPPSIANIRLSSGKFQSVRETRGPAPHLRHLIPPHPVILNSTTSTRHY